MSDAAEKVLERKLSNRRVGRSPLPETDLVGENFGRVLEEALRKLLKTNVGALIMESSVTRLSDVVDRIPVPAMLGLIEVDATDDMALINLSSDLVFHVVDMRMGGDPTATSPATTRSFTGIDTQLCEDVFTGVLASFRRALQETLDAPMPEAMRLIGTKQDITTVRIASKNADVLLLTVSLDIGEAARSGDFDLILPLSVLDIFVEAKQTVTKEALAKPKDVWHRQMQQSAAAAILPVDVILERLKMNLSDLQGLRPGQDLRLHNGRIDAVDLVLCMGQSEEHVIGSAQLGAYDGTKVVKMTDDPSVPLLTYLRRNLGDGSSDP